MKIRIIPSGEELRVDAITDEDGIIITDNDAQKLLKALKYIYEPLIPEKAIIAYQTTNAHTESPKKVIA